MSGVIVHNGNANNSHYTTYLKQKCTESEVVNLNDFCSDKYSIDSAYMGNWFYIDDCAVVPISLQEVIKSQANIIFYERLWMYIFYYILCRIMELLIVNSTIDYTVFEYHIEYGS